MKQPNIHLHIEELVLHRFALGDRYAIADAVVSELSRLLTANSVTPGFLNLQPENLGRQRVDAGNFQVVPGAKADSIGAQIAVAVYGGLTR
jgi:hypothetical protein